MKRSRLNTFKHDQEATTKGVQQDLSKFTPKRVGFSLEIY